MHPEDNAYRSIVVQDGELLVYKPEIVERNIRDINVEECAPVANDAGDKYALTTYQQMLNEVAAASADKLNVWNLIKRDASSKREAQKLLTWKEEFSEAAPGMYYATPNYTIMDTAMWYSVQGEIARIAENYSRKVQEQSQHGTSESG